MDAILSNITRKLLRFEIGKMLVAVKKTFYLFIVLFIIIFGAVSFPIH